MIKSKLENIYGLKDGQSSEDRVMVFFQGSGASKSSGNHSLMTFFCSCTNNSQHHAFFQCCFLFWQGWYSQTRRLLIFSGGSLTLTLLMPPPLHILKVPSQTMRRYNITRLEDGMTVTQSVIVLMYSERIYYQSFLCTSYLIFLYV